jgi:molybdopterin-guanine dinucleotide biosynthesis protein A/rhodanese-related sulfurtransferase
VSEHPIGPVTGAVLCGGKSRRMGRDKAVLPYEGVPMALRVASALRDGGCLEVVGVGGDATALGLAALPDMWPGEGPLGGVITALASAPGAAAVVVVACDLPLLGSCTIRRLVAALEGPFDAAMAVAGTVQPLAAAWRPSSRDALEGLFARGERRMQVALDEVRWVAVAVDQRELTNVNAESDLPSRVHSMPISEIDAAGLAAAIQGGARLVDVRETDEYVAGHVPGAVHVALATVPDNLNQFSAGATNYVICRSGGRSMRACEFLARQGLQVVNVAGGTLAWANEGLPMVTGGTPS